MKFYFLRDCICIDTIVLIFLIVSVGHLRLRKMINKAQIHRMRREKENEEKLKLYI